MGSNGLMNWIRFDLLSCKVWPEMVATPCKLIYINLLFFSYQNKIQHFDGWRFVFLSRFNYWHQIIIITYFFSHCMNNNITFWTFSLEFLSQFCIILVQFYFSHNQRLLLIWLIWYLIVMFISSKASHLNKKCLFSHIFFLSLVLYFQLLSYILTSPLAPKI